MNWLKAKIAIFIIVTVLATMIIPSLPLMTVAFIYDKRRKGINWLKNIFLGQDYTANAILGGDSMTYISALLGHLKLQGSRTGTLVANFVDWVWYITMGQKNHCVEAMRPSDIYEFSARRALAGFTLYILGYVLTGYAVIAFLLYNTRF